MTDCRYWIWLQRCLGEGAQFKHIIEDFGSVEALYHSNIMQWKMSTALTPQQLDRLTKYKLEDTERILAACQKNGWRIITFDDARYPEKLRQISNSPAVLYCDGELADFDATATIAVVGTRKASPYAMKVAELMAKGVSLCGAAVISGGALGVDAAAHSGALAAGAKTYAVLGCGLGTDYLRANQELRDRIKQGGGALITEYPPFTQASRTTFPMRNRIISGLSDGVLVVEAGVKSGSTITAQHALEQGRDVYAVPASLLDYHFYGTNRLIEDGATVATSPAVLLERYAQAYSSLDLSKAKTLRELDERAVSANAPQSKQLTFDEVPRERRQRLDTEDKAMALLGDEKTVYAALGNELTGIEEIIAACGIPAQKAAVALTMLEMKGLCESASGKRYKRK